MGMLSESGGNGVWSVSHPLFPVSYVWSLKMPPVTKNRTAAPAAAPRKPAVEVDPHSGRPILYPVLTVCGVEIPEEDRILTVEAAKEILGWETESEHIARLTEGLSPEQVKTMNVSFGDDYALKDLNGEKVALRNNISNRPLNETWMMQIAQDILGGNWRFNTETIIVGKTGKLLSGQHRLIGFVFAEMLRLAQDEKGAELRKRHPEPLTLEALVSYGVEETGDVTRTLDNVRPRSLSDVLFADTDTFKDISAATRESVCRLADYAIRTVRDRTGDDEDAFAPNKAHSESLDFLSRHPRLTQAVKSIHTECVKENAKGEKQNAKVLREMVGIGQGMAAGMMYLMGAGASDRDKWAGAENPSDRQLNFELWDKAVLFWSLLVNTEDRTMDVVRNACKGLDNPRTGQKGPVKAKLAVVVNAWNQYKDGGRITPNNIQPEYEEAAPGKEARLIQPNVEGIDLGDVKALRRAEKEALQIAKKAEEEAAKAEAEEAGELSEGEEAEVAETAAEVAARAAAVKAESLAKKRDEKPVAAAPKAPAAAPAPKAPLRGGTAKR